MATIKLGPNVVDIRGSVKEVVYSIWKAGVHYIRSKPAIISNPKSADQVAIRAIVAESSARWFTIIPIAQRAAWEEMATRLGTLSNGTNGQGGILNMIPPVGGIMSGVNAYVSLRAASFSAGLLGLFTDFAPLGEDQPANVSGLSAVWDPIAFDIDVSFVAPPPGTTDPAARHRLWLRSRELVYHRQLTVTEALGISPITLLTSKGAMGNGITFFESKPQHILIQMDTVNPSGFRSFGSETIEVETF